MVYFCLLQNEEPSQAGIGMCIPSFIFCKMVLHSDFISQRENTNKIQMMILAWVPACPLIERALLLLRLVTNTGKDA